MIGEWRSVEVSHFPLQKMLVLWLHLLCVVWASARAACWPRPLREGREQGWWRGSASDVDVLLVVDYVLPPPYAPPSRAGPLHEWQQMRVKAIGASSRRTVQTSLYPSDTSRRQINLIQQTSNAKQEQEEHPQQKQQKTHRQATHSCQKHRTQPSHSQTLVDKWMDNPSLYIRVK